MTDVVPVLEQQSAGRKRLVLAIGVLGVLTAGIFAALAIGGSSTTAGGADSPEEAYQQLLQAISDEDLLGAAELVLPSERETLVQPLFDLVGELQRLEVLDPALDLSAVSGVDFDFDGVLFETTMLTEDLATLRLVGGRTTTVVEPNAFPFGPLVLDRLPEGTIPDDFRTTSESISPSDDGLVAIRQNGKWYVSLWYSVAEAARLDAGLPLPDPDDAIVARGGGSPEAAVEEMIRAGIDLDVRRVLELLPPGEAAALHDYAPLFLPAAEEAAREARRSMRRIGLEIRLRHLELSSKKRGDDQIVSFLGGELVVTSDEIDVSIEVSDGSTSGHLVIREFGQDIGITVTGDCFELEVRDGSGEVVEYQRECAGDVENLIEQFLGSDVFVGGLPDFDIFNTDPVLGIATVKENGEWFVSPLATFLDGGVELLAAIDQQKLEDLIDWIIDQAESEILA